jgi:hypothetical protein
LNQLLAASEHAKKTLVETNEGLIGVTITKQCALLPAASRRARSRSDGVANLRQGWKKSNS